MKANAAIPYLNLPDMILPGSAKVNLSNGIATIEFVPNNGSQGQNAFIDVFTYLGNNTAESTEGEATNSLFVWLNYDKLYQFISIVDPDGLSDVSGDLNSYCVPQDISGNAAFTGTFKPICEPYFITVQTISPLVNPNFKTVELSGPITIGSEGSFDIDLAYYFVNQINEASKGYSTSVIYSGWTTSPYSEQSLTYSIIIFAAIVLLMILIVISYYGLAGVVTSVIASLIFMLLFVILFASSVQFSFITVTSIFIFTIINLLVLTQIIKKIKLSMQDTKKKPTTEYWIAIKKNISFVAIYSVIILLVGFISYTFGYQQIAIIGIIAFISVSLFIGLYIFLFIPFVYYLLTHFNSKDELVASKYNFVLGVINFKEPKPLADKLISSEKTKKGSVVIISSVLGFVSVLSLILFFTLSASTNSAIVNSFITKRCRCLSLWFS